MESPGDTADLDPNPELHADTTADQGVVVPLDLESPTVPVDAETAVDELLGQLQDGLQKAEAKMASILESIVDHNAHALEELESALSDMEAALANE